MGKNVRDELMGSRFRPFLLLGVLILFVLMRNIVQAQVTTNITFSGLGTTLNAGAPACTGNCTITGGDRPGGGTNLFHSFGLFNVGSGQTANFSNNTGLPTTNILSRVTGGPSNIFGTIQTTGFGSANFFLINPAGVVFGPNASWDIGRSIGTPGSFHVSTADYLRLGTPGTANAGVFSANPLVGDMLTSAPPAAFGFLKPNAVAIAVQGSTLAVGSGKTISVVGGDITMTGGMLSAPGGQINLASVASPGEVLLSNMQAVPNVNGDTFTAMGTMNLSAGATLDVSGVSGIGSEAGGTVYIRGGQFMMDSSVILADTQGANDGMPIALSMDVRGDIVLEKSSVISASSSASGRAGDIQISGKNVTFDGSGISTANMDAPGGNISISAETLSVVAGGFVSTLSFGAGDGGGITVSETGSVLVAGTDAFSTPSSISTEADDAGNGGSIIISASSLSVDLGAVRTTAFSNGNAGNITVQPRDVSIDVSITGGGTISSSGGGLTSGNISVAADILSIIGQSASAGSRITNENGGAGATGEIVVNVRNFLLSNGARITSEGAGSHGKIAVSATEAATISNGAKVRMANESGSGGLVDISAPVLTVDHGDVQTLTTGLGDAGATRLHGGTVNLSGGALIDSSSSGAGRGGDVQVQATNVRFTDAAVSAQSTSIGEAGNITIQVADSFISNNSAVNTSTTQSDGGNIAIKAGNLVQLVDSQITTNVQGGVGSGGNISIDPPTVIIEHSNIIASAIGGNGGNINIVAGVLLVSPDSLIDASSTFGLSGTITIESPITNLSGTLAPLPQGFVQTAAFAGRCAARIQGGPNSSLVVRTSRDRIPAEPGELLLSPLFASTQGIPVAQRADDINALRAGLTGFHVPAGCPS